MQAKFNDGSEEFKNQCIAFKAKCDCGYKFVNDEVQCPSCGAQRKRCQHRAMEGDTRCRSHRKLRPYGLMSRLASTLTDQPLEEILESDDLRGLDEPLAVAKLAISNLLRGRSPEQINDDDCLLVINAVKKFFEIAEKKNNIEKGQVLNISWDDKVVTTLREKLKTYFIAMKEVLDLYIEDEDLKRRILTDLYQKTKLVGNSLTIPEYKDETNKENL